MTSSSTGKLQLYAVAVAATGGGLLVRVALMRWLGNDSPFMVFALAVIFAAWFGGFGPGLLATFLSAAAAEFLFVEPIFTLTIESTADRLNVLLFVMVGVATSVLLDRLHRSRQELRARRDELRREVEERLDTERALRTSEDRLRSALEAGAMGTWELDLQSQRVLHDRNSRRLLRYDDEVSEHPLSTFLERVHPDDLPRIRVAIESAVSGKPQVAEYRLRRPNGEEIWLCSYGLVRRTPGGDPAHLAGVTFDVTDRHNAEEALRQKEQRLRIATDAARLGVYVWVVGEDRAVWENQRIYDIFQRSREEGPVTREELLRDYVHPDDRERVDREIQSAASVGGSIDVTFRIRLKDETEKWVEATGTVERNEAGEPARLVGVFADITERRAAEEALQQSESNFRTLADNIAQLAWMADDTGWIFWYNRRWFEYTGTTLEEMEGWGWRKVHHPDHVGRVVEKFATHIREGQVWEDTFPLRSKFGRYRWFLSRAMPIRDDEGKVVRWFGTNTDVTEQREAELALKEADRRKDQFLAVLAHELRNPLAPISNALTLLRKAGGDPARTARLHEVMDQQVGQMTRLIDDLLDVSRISRGKIVLKREQTDLRHIARTALEASRSAIDEAGHELVVHEAGDPLLVSADSARMTQVLSNLLNNAAKYTPGGGRITVTTERGEGEAIVRVQDTGVGIPSDRHDDIFEMFAQVENELDREHGGLGIGLTLVKSLVEMHGGRVGVRSEGAGKGSEFAIRLPLTELPVRPEPPVERRDENVPQGEGFQVLVVEDHAIVAELFAEMISDLGHEVRIASGGEAALEALRSFRPDVIFSDISMPGMDGYTLSRRIRSMPELEGAFLVAMTGYGQEEDRSRALDAGFDRHMVKPASEEDLRELFHQLAERRGMVN